MAINFGAGFNIAKAEAVDTRIYLKTLADMLTIDENVYPEVYFAICEENGKLYLFNKSNISDPTTGKFREVVGGASSDFTDNFSIVEIKDDPSDVNKVTGYKIFTKGINEITGDTELTNEILTASKIENTLLDLSEFDKVTP